MAWASARTSAYKLIARRRGILLSRQWPGKQREWSTHGDTHGPGEIRLFWASDSRDHTRPARIRGQHIQGHIQAGAGSLMTAFDSSSDKRMIASPRVLIEVKDRPPPIPEHTRFDPSSPARLQETHKINLRNIGGFFFGSTLTPPNAFTSSAGSYVHI